MVNIQETAYEKLLSATEDGYGKVPYETMIFFAKAADKGINVDTVAAPMIARVEVGSLKKIREHTTRLTDLGRVITLTATPAQLLELIKMDEVISLEASTEGGPIHN